MGNNTLTRRRNAQRQREIVDAEYILNKYPVNRRWLERHRDVLAPFKVPGGRKNFYFKDVVDALFQPEVP